MQILKTALGVILGIILMIFALQNTQAVSIYFFNMRFGSVPLFLVIILVFIAGFISGRLTGWAKTILLRKK